MSQKSCYIEFCLADLGTRIS